MVENFIFVDRLYFFYFMNILHIIFATTQSITKSSDQINGVAARDDWLHHVLRRLFPLCRNLNRLSSYSADISRKYRKNVTTIDRA